MKPPLKICAGTVAALSASVAISGCASFGTSGIKLAKSNPDYSGAVIFRDHCSGCHTLSVVGAEGSASSILDRVKTNAPNFDYRKETVADVLYALRNGGFSGEIMPQNIVVGKQADEVAAFLSKYSGLEKPKELGEAEAGAEAGESAESKTGGTEGSTAGEEGTSAPSASEPAKEESSTTGGTGGSSAGEAASTAKKK